MRKRTVDMASERKAILRNESSVLICLLRRGESSRTFGRKRVPGVADVIDNKISCAFRRIPLENKVNARSTEPDPNRNSTAVVRDLADCLGWPQAQGTNGRPGRDSFVWSC